MMKLLSRIIQALIDLGFSTRYRVDGDSMLPTLASRESVLAKRLRSSGTPLRRGDLVVLSHPEWPSHTYIKRLVGLPDEDIRLDGGRVYVNGVLLKEEYVNGPHASRPEYDREWWTGPDQYFVLGDNRDDSHDSRAFGPVSRQLILGRVWFRCWPPAAVGPVDREGRGPGK